MKKRLCLMLASIMVVSMLAACGGKEAGNEGGNESGERPEGVQITMGRKVVTNAMLPEGQDVEENALIWKTEEELKIDLVDEFNGVDADYDQKVSMAMTSGFSCFIYRFISSILLISSIIKKLPSLANLE